MCQVSTIGSDDDDHMLRSSHNTAVMFATLEARLHYPIIVIQLVAILSAILTISVSFLSRWSDFIIIPEHFSFLVYGLCVILLNLFAITIPPDCINSLTDRRKHLSLPFLPS